MLLWRHSYNFHIVCFTQGILVSSNKSKLTKIQAIFQGVRSISLLLLQNTKNLNVKLKRKLEREYKRFTRAVWVISDKVKSAIKDQDTLHIEKT